MLEYLEKSDLMEDDNFLLVQLTSPFTTSSDFDKALEIFQISDYDSMLSAASTTRFFWDRNSNPVNYDYRNRPRRQDFEGIFVENGAFYINTVSNIIKHKNRLSGNIGIHEMPEYTSYEIDEPDDWVICEQLMKRHVLNKKTSIPDIKLFITDVDGVLTDAGMYYAENGDELKKFNTRDGKGFEFLRNKGIKTAIITSEKTKIVENRAKKLKINYLFQGITNKLECAMKVCQEENITLENVAFIGDDINDSNLLNKVALCACPADAVEEVRSLRGIFHLKKKGGEGAVREFIEYIVSNK